MQSTTIEGLYTLNSIYDLINKKKVQMPIIDLIYSIIYEGKIYDAYSIMLDILNEAKEEIIIIDNYVNKELLDTLRKIDNNIYNFEYNIRILFHYQIHQE